MSQAAGMAFELTNRPHMFRCNCPMKIFRPILLLTSLLVSAIGASAASTDTPITPDRVIVLYNGKEAADLSPFYTWLGPLGKDNDPNRVFSIVDQIDGAPAIRSSGQEFGGIVTRQSYANYKLVLEYRWGNATWGPRKDRARNSGILLHCQGEDGNYKDDFKGPWLSSIEYEILEGRTGDIILVGGFVRGSKEKILPRLTMTQSVANIWDPNGTPKVCLPGPHLHWQNWDPNWKDVLGFRGARDVDKPVGQW